MTHIFFLQYLERTKPLYERRNEIIAGSVPPTADEIAAGEAQAAKDAKEAGEGGDWGLCRIPLAMAENFFWALATVPRFGWKTENMRGQRTGRRCGPAGKYDT